jgi:hypothetical protein
MIYEIDFVNWLIVRKRPMTRAIARRIVRTFSKRSRWYPLAIEALS